MTKYDETSIEVLEDLEHLRKRPGMYVGTVDSDGIFQLLKECVDNSTDEFLAHCASSIFIDIDTHEHICCVCDDGRGIPVGIHAKTGISTLTTVLTMLQSGGKFEEGAYSVSAGLHGVGLKATNALSAWLEAKVWKGKKCYVQRFDRGKYTKEPVRDPSSDLEDNIHLGTQIRFKPDSEIFGKARIDPKKVAKWLQETSHLCPGLRIELKVNDKVKVFESGGLGQLITEQVTSNKLEFSHTPIVYKSNDGSIQLALAWALQDEDTIGASFWSFVNASATREHGTHIVGLKNAIVDSLKSYTADKLDQRDLFDGLYAAIHVLVKDPQFKSQTKDSLLNNDVTQLVYNDVYPFLKAYFDSNKAVATQIIERATQLKDAREAYKRKRNAINKVVVNKKGARGILPDKLAEAPFCLPQEREIFIVEGDSAAGSARKARDATYQEILPLRGKILNAARCELDKLLSNKEISDILTAIGARVTSEGIDTSKLRVGKIILLADGDCDGGHIESLILTFITSHLQGLLDREIVYIVDSPLFVGTYKDKHYFGHTLQEVSTKSKVETSRMGISRLKGHGEASYQELKEYAMDYRTRKLWKVEFGKEDKSLVLNLMGAESQSRKLLLGI